MSTNTRQTIDVERSGKPTLEDLSEATVLRCRGEDGLEWFYDLESDGTVIRYHERFDYRGGPVLRAKAEAVLASPGVETAVLPNQYLEIEREKQRGETA